MTRRADGTIVIAVWNLFLPEEKGEPKNVTLELKGARGQSPRAGLARRCDARLACSKPTPPWARPAYPTAAQIEKLRQAAAAPAAGKNAIAQWRS